MGDECCAYAAWTFSTLFFHSFSLKSILWLLDGWKCKCVQIPFATWLAFWSAQLCRSRDDVQPIENASETCCLSKLAAGWQMSVSILLVFASLPEKMSSIFAKLGPRNMQLPFLQKFNSPKVCTYWEKGPWQMDVLPPSGATCFAQCLLLLLGLLPRGCRY